MTDMTDYVAALKQRAEQAEARVKELETQAAGFGRNCGECGAQWLPSSVIDNLSDLVEPYRQRAKELESSLSTATAKIAELEREVAWTAIEYDNPDTYPPEPKLVLVALSFADGRGPMVSQATWEAERGTWLDIETDGQNDHIEWAPGEVTHWRPMPKPPEER